MKLYFPKVGDLVTTHYRNCTGIVYVVTEVTGVDGMSAVLKPHLDPCGNPVTKKHGYHGRHLHSHWCRKWKPKPTGTSCPVV